SLLFHTDLTLNTGLGVGVAYKVYDKDFNDISSTIKSDGFLLYRLSTLHTSVFDGNYSGFTAPNTLTGNWRNVDNKPPLHNDKLVFEPTTQWGAYYDKKDSIYQYPDIKYVKFFVHYDP